MFLHFHIESFFFSFLFFFFLTKLSFKKEPQKISNGIFKLISRKQTYNAMAGKKKKKTRRQPTIFKPQHRKLKTEQHKTQSKKRSHLRSLWMFTKWHVEFLIIVHKLRRLVEWVHIHYVIKIFNHCKNACFLAKIYFVLVKISIFWVKISFFFNWIHFNLSYSL